MMFDNKDIIIMFDIKEFVFDIFNINACCDCNNNMQKEEIPTATEVTRVNVGGKKNKKVTKKSMRKKQRKKITNKRYNSKKLKRNKIVKTRKHRN